MSAFWGNLSGVVTVILMVVFIGIWIWAWRARHKRVFDRMARLPLDDDGSQPGNKPGSADEEDPR